MSVSVGITLRTGQVVPMEISDKEALRAFDLIQSKLGYSEEEARHVVYDKSGKFWRTLLQAELGLGKSRETI